VIVNSAYPIDHDGWTDRKSEFRLPDGRLIAFVDTGGPGPILVLLHGYSDSSRSFSLIEPFLRGFRLIIPDLPGHGSSTVRTGWSVSDLAGDVGMLIDYLSIVPEAIVGHSLGAMTAIKLASLETPRTRSLITIAGTLSPKFSPTAPVSKQIFALRDPIDSCHPFFKFWHSGPQDINQDFLKYISREAASMPASVWRAILSELYTLSLTEDAGKISVPTLSISGSEDELFDESHGLDLQGAISGTRAIIMEGHGHNPHWESPLVVSSHIRDFLQKFGS
jgi:pimeloyl-ACP methyl ester carboxylesterase